MYLILFCSVRKGNRILLVLVYKRQHCILEFKKEIDC